VVPDGRTAVFRWRSALTSQDEAVLHAGELSREFDVAFVIGEDRAEEPSCWRVQKGLALFDMSADNASAHTMKTASISSILEDKAVAGSSCQLSSVRGRDECQLGYLALAKG
jgi:hypothetical protein